MEKEDIVVGPSEAFTGKAGDSKSDGASGGASEVTEHP